MKQLCTTGFVSYDIVIMCLETWEHSSCILDGLFAQGNVVIHLSEYLYSCVTKFYTAVKIGVCVSVCVCVCEMQVENRHCCITS